MQTAVKAGEYDAWAISNRCRSDTDAEHDEPPELSEVLSAPAGVLSLHCESSGCFYHEVAEMHLSWSPFSAVLRTPEGEEPLALGERAAPVRIG